MAVDDINDVINSAEDGDDQPREQGDRAGMVSSLCDLGQVLEADGKLDAMDGVLVQPMISSGVEVMVGVTAVIALYFNVFVGIVQAFLKVPALHAMAPTQTGG